MYTFFIKIKRNIIPLLICFFILLLLLFSKTNLMACKNGLILWATSIVPSLFPFFVATELLNQTNIPNIFGRYFYKYMNPLFNVPGEGAYAFIMGIICGYPTGAKIVSNFYNDGICSKSEAERMLAFTNNSGPLFILATVGVSFFGNTKIGILLLVTHLLASLSVGFLFGIISRLLLKHFTRGINTRSIKTQNINEKVYNSKNCSIHNLGDLLISSISSSVSTLFIIGGFVILFCVIISILNNINFFDIFTLLGIPLKYSKPIISGIIELTTGVSLASSIIAKNISYNIIICAFLLGFGGISVLLQVFSISSKNHLSIKWYFFGKLLQGGFAALYTFIILNNFNFINFNL